MSGSKNLLSTSWEFIRPPVRSDEAGRSVECNLPTRDISPQQPRYIEVQHGNIFLTPQAASAEKIAEKDSDKADTSAIPYQERISELEDAVCRLQKIVYQSQTGFSATEDKLLRQVNMLKNTLCNNVATFKNVQLEQAAFKRKHAEQEKVLKGLREENRALQRRVQQYEHLLDDVSMRVVNAIMAEERLRAEFAVLKEHIKDLEIKNAIGSPARGRDEGYCTLSSGPPPSILENLPEEPEQWLLSDGGHPAEMEDWSLSQEELVGQSFEEEDANNDWVVGKSSSDFTTLLNEEIVYSESEELTCKDFTSDFYKLVNIQPESCKSLTFESDGTNKVDSESDIADNCSCVSDSLGMEQLCSCTSSDESTEMYFTPMIPGTSKCSPGERRQCFPPRQWKRSSGWRKISLPNNESTSTQGN